jgi:hypothetical protein
LREAGGHVYSVRCDGVTDELFGLAGVVGKADDPVEEAESPRPAHVACVEACIECLVTCESCAAVRTSDSAPG